MHTYEYIIKGFQEGGITMHVVKNILPMPSNIKVIINLTIRHYNSIHYIICKYDMVTILFTFCDKVWVKNYSLNQVFG